MEEGVVPGGGTALLRAVRALDALVQDNDDRRMGIEIVRRAIQVPARQIALNAGEDGSVIVGKVLDKSDYGYGFNAQTGQYGDLYKFGIIDPVKVVRIALQDSASIAGLVITTEAMIAERYRKESPPLPGHGHGHPHGMDEMDF